ncbi:alanine--glyoxylate aminotransferase family protein [Salinirubellus sp. GCM10025818]|uniref:pyridoxal-phosphate-dependent aminotransferase family protein n=1 Tax=Salinirubellus TaxID=2162630 RepID=UPI0030CEAB3D
MTDTDERLLMTPGPTALPPEVREALGRPLVNPDVEPGFTADYRRLLDKLAEVHGTDDDVVVLGGEGILGLEASVASLVASGETVLCLANGLYGEGFADFVETHGGEAVVHSVGEGEVFDPDEIASLADEHDPVAATMVHCETPIGLLNDIEGVLETLQDAGVLTVVDAVSSLGGTPVPTQRIDVCLGASQKCFSSPPGLSTLTVSERAWEKVEATPQDSFYASLEPWRDVDLDTDQAVLLPYTHLTSNLYALEASLDRLLEEGLEAVYERHEDVAERCRERGREAGLDPLPPVDRSSPTVTAFEIDGGAERVCREVRERHGIVLSTGLADHADDVVRVGHMGYGADRERVDVAMDALADVLN